jgi:hypothetical protein
MKITNRIFLAAFFITVFVIPGFANAQATSPQNVKTKADGKTVLIATLNIQDAKITGQEGNKLKISFNLFNRENIQPGVKYAVVLKDAENKTVIDQKVYDETLTVGPNQTLSKIIEYQAPEYLKGEYNVWIMSKGFSGSTMAATPAGKVSFSGSGEYLEIKNGTCFTAVEGKPKTKTDINQIMRIADSENIVLDCAITNHLKDVLQASPKFVTYLKSSFGGVVSAQEGNSSIDLSKKEFSLTIPKIKTSQAYEVEVSFIDQNKNIISNTLYIRYIQGENLAAIKNIRLAKDYYTVGEKAEIIFNWVFRGKNNGETNTMEASIKDSENNLCANLFSTELQPVSVGENMNIQVPITKNCSQPHFSFSLKDKQGNVLDSESFIVGQKKVEPKPEVSDSAGLKNKLLGLIVLIIVLIAGIFYVKNKKKAGMAVLVGFFLAGSFFMFANKAKADEWYHIWGGWYPQYSDIIFNIDKSSYAQNETIIGTGSDEEYIDAAHGISASVSWGIGANNMYKAGDGMTTGGFKLICSTTNDTDWAYCSGSGSQPAPSALGSYFIRIWQTLIQPYAQPPSTWYYEGAIPFTVTAPIPINGACGVANNACTAGDLNDTADNPTNYLWQCLGSFGGSTASCSLPKTAMVPSKVVATIIVCDNESDLPNWDGAAGPITSNTATNFLDTHPTCHTESGWFFQQSNYTSLMGCNTYDPNDLAPGNTIGQITAPSGFCPWVAFGPTDSSGVAVSDISSFPFHIPGDDLVYIREDLKTGYLPFTSPPPPGNSFSAELWCDDDIRFYDNGDKFFPTSSTGETFYCVAFNVLKATKPDLTASAPSPSTATAGTAQTFTATISNIGSASTGASFNNFFQVASAANGGGTITSKTATSMGALAAGGTNTTSVSHTFASAGTYSVRACADNTGLIPESDEGNNCSPWTNVTVSSAASYSYTVNDISFSATQNGSLPSAQNITITNTGDQPLTIGISETITWASINKSTVTIPAGGSDMVTVSIATTALSPNTYSGTVNFTNAQAGNKSSNITYVVSNSSCTSLTYKPATSGFTTNSNGSGVASSISIAAGSTFYAFVDYGQSGIDAIIAPNVSGDFACVWDNAWIGTAGRFICTAPASATSYVYTTGTNSGTSSNICASGAQNVGTVTVSGSSTTSDPPDGPPEAKNFLMDAAVACDNVKLSWTDQSSNETGFKIFMDGNLIHTTAANVTEYTYTPPDNNPHNYFIASTNAAGDSAQVPAGNNPVSSVICQSNLNGSSKVLTKVNGAVFNPSVTSLKKGDKVEFTITLSNSGTLPATKIFIMDTFTNLKIPSGGLNAVYHIGASDYTITQGADTSGHYLVKGGSEPNQTVKFNLTGSTYNVPAQSGSNPSMRTLTFEAEIAVPTGYIGLNSRMQNVGIINYIGGPSPTKTVATPLYIFLVGDSPPVIIEIPPGN